MTVEIDSRFRAEIERLIDEHDLRDLDKLMTYDDYFEEPPLFTRYAAVSFLDALALGERCRVLVRAAAAYLRTILDHSRSYYEGREYDYHCAVTIPDAWEEFEDGDVLVPCFWFANPSRGVFDHVSFDPPESRYSRLVAGWLDHDPDYVVNECRVRRFGETVVERIFVHHVSCLPPAEI